MGGNTHDVSQNVQDRISTVATFVADQMTASTNFLNVLKTIDEIQSPTYVPNSGTFPPQGANSDFPKYADASTDELDPVTFDAKSNAILYDESSIDQDLADAQAAKPDATAFHDSIETIMADVDQTVAAIDEGAPTSADDQEVQDELDASMPSGVAAAIGSAEIDLPTKQDFTDRYDMNSPDYTSTLLDSLKDKAKDGLSGGSGVSQTVTDELWSRDEARLNSARDRALSKTTSQMATWGMPAFMVADAQKGILLRDSMDRNTLAKDKTAKSAELEQKNIQKSIAASLQLETTLIQHYNTMMDRALLAARTVVEVSISIMDGQLQKVAQLFEIGKTRVDAKIDVENMKLERYGMAVKALIKKLDAAMGRISGHTDLYKVNSEVYKSALIKAETVASLKLAIDDMQAKHDGFNIEMAGKANDLNSKNYIELNSIRQRILEALTRFQLETNEQAIQSVEANKRLNLEAAAENMRGFLDAAMIHLDAAEAGAKVRAQAIAAARGAITVVQQLGSGSTAMKTE